MKRWKLAAAACAAVAALLVGQRMAAGRGGDGWYEMSGAIEDTTRGRRVMQLRDCRAVSFDSVRMDTVTVYEIVGEVVPRKRALWAEVTERNVGRSLGFVYGGRVVCRPFIHLRVESGRFSVTATDGERMRALYGAMDRNGD